MRRITNAPRGGIAVLLVTVAISFPAGDRPAHAQNPSEVGQWDGGGVGTSDLLELLAGWGPCPTPDLASTEQHPVSSGTGWGEARWLKASNLGWEIPKDPLWRQTRAAGAMGRLAEGLSLKEEANQ